jgi:hypothetical protein
MPRNTRWILTLILFIWPSICLAVEAPHKLAGFALGDKLRDHIEKVDMDTVLPLRYLESLKEVEAKDIRGFKTGLISYGTCMDQPRIVRLKFKYADASKTFYDELLERFKARFGKPDEYRGDPFHIVVAWKWSFIDKDNNNISLILQHNIRDEEEKQGNSVKMTMWNLFNQEIHCFENKQPVSAKSESTNSKFNKTDSIDWEHFIPH